MALLHVPEWPWHEPPPPAFDGLPPETDFDRGLRHFGYLLTSAMLILVLLVFVAHMFLGRPPTETLLFAVALAVGLSPEPLPAILSVSLARGAQMMARHGVLVRRLNEEGRKT